MVFWQGTPKPKVGPAEKLCLCSPDQQQKKSGGTAADMEWEEASALVPLQSVCSLVFFLPENKCFELHENKGFGLLDKSHGVPIRYWLN